ncbi:hypothetical protein D499_0D01420 [Hanseniaspora uvarum DSM 2768]|nr:hypothetical protein D499_0D01420 [Hanseniaspora uvarum DSM 2768]
MPNSHVTDITISAIDNDPVNTTIISSTIASMISMSLSQPFEVIKIGQQLSFGNYGFGMKHVNVLYYSSGLSALNAAIVSKNILRFPLYNYIMKFLERNNKLFDHHKYHHHLSSITNASSHNILTAGAITGFLESCLYIPFENMKSRMVGNSILLSERAQGVHLSNSPYMVERRDLYTNKQPLHLKNTILHYRANPSINFFTAFKEICQTDGLKGFFRGTIPTATKFSCNSIINFGVYSLINERILINNKNDGSSYNPLSLALLTTISCSSAIILLTQPLDFIKTRTQSNRFGPFYYGSLTDCIKKVIKEEQISALYKGWAPRLMKVNILNFGIHLGLYSYLETAINLN